MDPQPRNRHWKVISYSDPSQIPRPFPTIWMRIMGTVYVIVITVIAGCRAGHHSWSSCRSIWKCQGRQWASQRGKSVDYLSYCWIVWFAACGQPYIELSVCVRVHGFFLFTIIFQWKGLGVSTCSSVGCMSVCLHYNTNVTLKDWCKIYRTFLLVLDMPCNPQSLSPNFSLVHAQVGMRLYTDTQTSLRSIMCAWGVVGIRSNLRCSYYNSVTFFKSIDDFPS